MGSATPKQFMMLGEWPLMLHALRVFERTPSVAEVILVVPQGERTRALTEVVERYGVKKVLKVVAGGATRQESVSNGLRETDDDTEIVVIHDAVRPFVTEDLIARSIEAARRDGGAIVAVPMKDTPKRVGPDGRIQRTLDRSGLWLAQTPQTFRRELILEAYRQAERDGLRATDDAALVERLGRNVGIVPGRWDNIKITTPEEFVIAEAILAARSGEGGERQVRRPVADERATGSPEQRAYREKGRRGGMRA